MNEVNTVVSESLASIAAIKENISRLAEEAKVARQKALEPFLAALAASGEVSIIVVRGYTPGFNDGEPCEHSADVYVNIKSVVGDEIHESVEVELPNDLLEGIEEEQTYNRETCSFDTNEAVLEANEALCRAHGHVYAEPSAEIMNAINTLIFTTAEEENGTNYYVTYVLKNGKFEVSSGEYDCGY